MQNSNTTKAEDLRIYQIIDANLDRAREGLRVLEDWARFGLGKEKYVERIKNFNVSIKELKDDIIFLRKLKEGGTAHSFGIHVAKMAGMPNEVIKNAEKKLKFLESSNSKKTRTIAIDEEINQTKIEFCSENSNYSEVIDNIKNLDLNSLSPIDALLSLNEIKKKLKS